MNRTHIFSLILREREEITPQIFRTLEPNGTTAFPDTITDLHCFDENIHDMDYYRPCEKAVREIDVSVFFYTF